MKRLLRLAFVIGIPFAFCLAPRFCAGAEAAVPFDLKSSTRTSHNRLVIPKKFLENRSAFALQGNTDNGADLRTVIAGVAISASLIGLVFLIIRKKGRAAQMMLLMMGVLGVGFLWGNHVSADGPPPAQRLSESWERFAGDNGRYVIVEITEEGEAIELILNQRFRSEYYRKLERSKERARMKAQRPEMFEGGPPAAEQKPLETKGDPK